MPKRGRTDILGVTGAQTVIGTGVTLTGRLHGEGEILIDGTLTGEVKTDGDITIGVNAVIKAPLTGVNISIAGQVEGNISAQGEVAIAETGRVTGNIASTSLSIASGAIFMGQSHMRQTQRPSQE